MKCFRTALGVFCALGIFVSLGLFSPIFSKPLVESLPATGDAVVAPAEVPKDKEPRISRKMLLSLLRQNVKYVFILYQENRSFDSYFGTFPGVEGIYSHPQNQTPGFTQSIENPDGTTSPIQPFRIGPKEYAADLDDVGHGHLLLTQKMDVTDRKPLMDKFALSEEMKKNPTGFPSLQDKQLGEITMAHEDGETIPFLWRYADRFVIFDHFFQLMVGPSTPGNLSIIAAQSGQTQAALHPDQMEKNYGKKGAGEPVLNSSDPYWGSPEDTGSDPKMPVNPKDFSKKKKQDDVQNNQTYATLPLSLAGSEAESQTSADPDKDSDLEDLGDDVAYLTQKGSKAISWGWYQEGFGEPVPGGEDPTDADGVHMSYVTHHNGPQYFGYIVHSPAMADSLHDLKEFLPAVAKGTLSPERGVYYVKGGYRNRLGMKPADPDPVVQKRYLGDDDHPGGSDSQISEAMLAKTINAIAQSQYWKNCAIIIAWDDDGGFYDHVPPPLRVFGPDKEAISDGPRVPFLLISPYARAHSVVHETGDHGSVVKFVDTLFGLTPLAKLPDEIKGRKLGKKNLGQDNWGPDDAITPGVSDLMAAFDPARLNGDFPPLPPDYAAIPETIVEKLPEQSGFGLKDIGIVPVDQTLGLSNPVPADFDPRPQTNPTPVSTHSPS
jgi:phospholipase C